MAKAPLESIASLGAQEPSAGVGRYIGIMENGLGFRVQGWGWDNGK